MVASTVQGSVGDGAGGAGGSEVKKAVAAGASVASGADRDAEERIPGGTVTRSRLVLAERSCGLEWEAPERRGKADHSPRTVSRFLSTSMAAVW